MAALRNLNFDFVAFREKQEGKNMARITNPFEEEIYPPFLGMPKDALVFLRGLKRNNTREWFEKNKERFEQTVKDPFLSLLHEVGEQLHSFHASIVVDPKKNAYRIYRDIRFSKDKTPYKTWIAASFTFKGGDRKTSPGFYLHIGADELIIGGGLWDPIPEKLKRLRASIDANPKEMKSILGSAKFKQTFTALEGESLKSVPKGFEKDHPAAELLKRKQFLCSITLQPEASLKKQFVKTAVDTFKAMTPFVKYLFEKS